MTARLKVLNKDPTCFGYLPQSGIMYHQMEGLLQIIKIYTSAVYFVDAFTLLHVTAKYVTKSLSIFKHNGITLSSDQCLTVPYHNQAHL
jgi:hypothetical protein